MDWRVETRGREVIAYWEGDRAFLFHAGWGVDPPVLSVPSERAWDAVVPAWLLGRRDEVVERLRLQSGHVLEETDVGYAAGKGELRPVGSKDDAYAIAAAFLDSIPGIVGPWEPETFREVDDGWRLDYRHLEPKRYAPALRDGRAALVVRRDTGELSVLPAAAVD